MTASLDLLLLLAAATVVAAALVGRDRPGGWVVLAFYLAQLAVLFQLDPASESRLRLTFSLLGESVAWRFDGLSWFFAAVTLGAAALTTWFASGAWSDRLREQGVSPRGLHVALALNVLAMLLLLGAADLLSLFMGWELVSWAGLLLMVLGGGEAVRAGIRYITYAIAGGMAVLAGLVLLFAWTGSLQLAALAAALPGLSAGQLWALALLFFGGFALIQGQESRAAQHKRCAGAGVGESGGPR